jgi:hypothetical protein
MFHVEHQLEEGGFRDRSIAREIQISALFHVSHRRMFHVEHRRTGRT